MANELWVNVFCPKGITQKSRNSLKAVLGEKITKTQSRGPSLDLRFASHDEAANFLLPKNWLSALSLSDWTQEEIASAIVAFKRYVIYN